ncbi:MAG: OPT/YSL family transporter, partial [Phycisphaerae bacterium]|nr:OPT/YSL family transporter [Phycisphaerae bacterium]
TMPAIYILKLNTNLEMSNLALFFQIALVPFLGAILGVIFLIPFRRYFVKEMHGKLPFPEATATNEILVTGASGSTSQAWILIYSFVLSAVYTFVATGLRLFSDTFTTGVAKLEAVGKVPVETLAFGGTGLFAALTTKIKAVFSMGAGAYYLGLGFIIGPRFASIICAGSLLSCFAIIPLLSNLSLEDLHKLNSACTAHKGPEEDAPRFMLPIGLADKLDQFRKTDEPAEVPEVVRTSRDEVRSAFAHSGVELAEDAEFSTTELGQQWQIKSKEEDEEQIYTVKATETELAVHRGTEKQPTFSIPLALASKLDDADPKGFIRKELGDEFARGEHPFHKENVAIRVETAGSDWVLKDKYQTYVLRADPQSNDIAVIAREASATEIFSYIPKNIGIGAIFTAGLLSILKMSRVIVTALSQALGALLRRRKGPAVLDRTDEDMGYGMMAILGIIAIIAMAFFFRFTVLSGMEGATWLTFMSLLIVVVIAFLFTTVSAWCIAMISVTPVSGMTVTTIIITAVLLAAVGLPRGDQGMLATLLVGGVVCTALSMAGGIVTNFKLAYWLGASPRKIAWSQIGGALISAIFVGGTIMVLAYQPGYSGEGAIPAPQANMMASALESFLGTGEVPWLLYGTGVVIALLIELIGIPAIAFGLGMYLPMYINTPILIGAFVSLLVKKSSKNEKLSKARSNKGILMASGLIAGGAIMEVLVNFTTALDERLLGVWTMVGEAKVEVGKIMPFFDMSGRMIDGGMDPVALARTQNWIGALLFLALCVFVYFDCRRAKVELAEGGELH